MPIFEGVTIEPLPATFATAAAFTRNLPLRHLPAICCYHCEQPAGTIWRGRVLCLECFALRRYFWRGH